MLPTFGPLRLRDLDGESLQAFLTGKKQADGTAWMAPYCQQMFEIALELAHQDPSYEGLAVKFLEHFMWIAGSMDRKLTPVPISCRISTESYYSSFPGP